MAIGCVLFTWNYIPKAFPLVTVDITMDRQMAMDRAEEVAQSLELGPDNSRLAASYNLNSQVQNYVELEAGGADAFKDILDSGLYSPYTWDVRLFTEMETNEATIRFTPQGEPWGIVETLSEEEPGENIPADSARAIAETAAAGIWSVNMNSFTLVETSENMQTGGRLDQTFVYERMDEKFGEADYRLRLRVSGDKFTELTHFVRVPEAFDRRFEELRSANSTLANVASVVMIVLFGLFGCGFGLFYLIKNRYVTWKQPVLVSTIIAFLVMLTMFNTWPLQWMNYDTALSFQNHIIMQISTALLAFVGMAILFSFIFIVAESLTRKAFPDHINFWKIWSPGVASSKQVLGITFAAFLLVCYELSYITGTYFFTTSVLDWWYPSSALFNPDVIAEYFPWLTALAISLQAAFWEEALFRAIPIAGAVLIGQRYGKTTLWVIAAFAVQAVIFGAAHADYPQLPFYARTVELILPSVIFGLVFYFWGLYPVILIHCWYNFVWFSMPIFAASTPGIFMDKIIIILIGLLPFWIILLQWFRTKSLGERPEESLNRSWTPETKPVSDDQKNWQESGPDKISVFTPAFIEIAAVTGLAGLAVGFFVTDFSKDAPPVEASRTEAVQLAHAELNQRNIELDDSWQAFSRVYGGISTDYRFIWQEGGADTYEELLGSYLNRPLWYVRYVTYEGDVEERAEEFRIFIAGRDSIRSFRHVIPEHRPGENLSEDQARTIADQTISNVHQLEPETLVFISAESSSLPERTDWTMAYADTSAYPLDEGEARIRVRIAGDEVVGTNRFIHVPEEWSRQHRDDRIIPNISETISLILSLLLYLAGIIYAIIRWTKGKFSVRAFLILSGGVLLINCINIYNMWPLTQIGFSTAQPYFSQAKTSISIPVVVGLITSITFGLLGGMIQRWNIPVSEDLTQNPGKLISTAAFPILAVLGLFALISGFSPQALPDWGNAGMAGASSPLLAGILHSFTGFFSAILLLTFLFGTVHYVTNGWQKRQTLFSVLIFLSGFAVAGNSVENVSTFMVTGVIAGILFLLFYVYIIRHHMPLIILMTAFYFILDSTGSLVSPMYPAEAFSWVLRSILTVTIAWYWHMNLTQSQPVQPSVPATETQPAATVVHEH